MNRREFVTLLGGAAVTWPVVAQAQQASTSVIGVLSSRAPGENPHLLAAFRQSLLEAGYAEGKNLAIEYRYGENQYDRLQSLADDLVRRQVTVIAAFGAAASLAAKAATSTIPIVFGGGPDPIQLGLVASLNRPSGNITGLTNLNVEVGPKRLELLHELVPQATDIAVLFNPVSPNVERVLKDLQVAAGHFGLKLRIVHARAEHEFEAVFASLNQIRAGGLIIGPDAFFNSKSTQLAELTVRHTLPTIYQYREFAAAGGLISYGSSLTHVYQQVAIYAGRVLKGEKPADLPVVQSTKVELIINLKTAKALGLTIPLPLLGRADEVIE